MLCTLLATAPLTPGSSGRCPFVSAKPAARTSPSSNDAATRAPRALSARPYTPCSSQTHPQQAFPSVPSAFLARDDVCLVRRKHSPHVGNCLSRGPPPRAETLTDFGFLTYPASDVRMVASTSDPHRPIRPARTLNCNMTTRAKRFTFGHIFVLCPWNSMANPAPLVERFSPPRVRWCRTDGFERDEPLSLPVKGLEDLTHGTSADLLVDLVAAMDDLGRHVAPAPPPSMRTGESSLSVKNFQKNTFFVEG